MRARHVHPFLALTLLGLALAPRGLSETPGQKAARASLSGTWGLQDEVSEDPFRVSSKGSDHSTGFERPQGGSGTRGRGMSTGGSGMGDLPLEAMVDARFLEINDNGFKVEVIYPSGRKRLFFPDGDERELDDGDGLAKVTVKLKGERVVVSSKWSTGRSLTETWELLGTPRRLTVTGKAKGRQSYEYRRVYQPEPPRPRVTPTTTPSSFPTVDATASTPAATGAPPVVIAPAAGMATC